MAKPGAARVGALAQITGLSSGTSFLGSELKEVPKGPIGVVFRCFSMVFPGKNWLFDVKFIILFVFLLVFSVRKWLRARFTILVALCLLQVVVVIYYRL